MNDEAVGIRASGLQAGERVTIRGQLVDGGGAQWTSKAEFVADAQGSVDTATQAPVSQPASDVSAK
jgi:hypothetical protein